jgi:FkbM family methyltransferase
VTRWNFIATANFAEDWQTYPEGFRMFEDAPAAQPPAPAAPTPAPAPARMPSSVEVIQRLGHKCRGTIDIGANHGSEIVSYRAAGLHWAVMVEPNPEPFRRLQAAIGNTPNYLAIPALCAASAGVEHDFHVDPGGGQASSMLRPSGVLTMAPQVKFEKPIKLVSTTVDLIMAQLAASQPGFSIDAIDIMSIDVQGAELEVLKGATKTLQTVKYVFCEVSYGGIYEGDACIEALQAFLHGYGFRLNWTDINRWNWGDALFIRP